MRGAGALCASDNLHDGAGEAIMFIDNGALGVPENVDTLPRALAFRPRGEFVFAQASGMYAIEMVVSFFGS